MPDEVGSEIRWEVKRHSDRAHYDRSTIDAILDEAMFCHVAFVSHGHPYVIPTIHVRVDDTLIFHGSSASRMLRTLRGGAEASVVVTILDGLVLARSVFNHSMNYRSVVLFGRPEEISGQEEKLRALRMFTEKMLPGRWQHARQPSEREMNATIVLRLPIDMASAKIRSGPPEDDPGDLDWDVWAGVIPYQVTAGDPQPAPDLSTGTPFPRELERRYD